MTHTEESLMELADEYWHNYIGDLAELNKSRDTLRLAIREVLAERDSAMEIVSTLRLIEQELDDYKLRAEKAESECERLKALCVGCLDIYYVVDPPFPADAMRNYLEENGINLEHYTYKRDQP